MKFLKFLPTAIINSIVEKAVETLIERGEFSTCFVTPGDKYPFEYGIQGYKIRLNRGERCYCLLDGMNGLFIIV